METDLYAQDGWRILWLGRVGYQAMLARQEALVAEMQHAPGNLPDTLFLLEHEPVYTIGRNPNRSSLVSAETLPYAVETIHRGGQATYHGPGQLIGYPIIDLNRRARDLHLYLRTLEEVLLQTLAGFGVSGQRREGLTGVWVGEQKVASIGVGVRRWVTLHGFALNVSGGPALGPFNAITPCGIQGVTMTALEAHHRTGETPTVEQVSRSLAAIFPTVLDAHLPARQPAVATSAPSATE